MLMGDNDRDTLMRLAASEPVPRLGEVHDQLTAEVGRQDLVRRSARAYARVASKEQEKEGPRPRRGSRECPPHRHLALQSVSALRVTSISVFLKSPKELGQDPGQLQGLSRPAGKG